MWLWPVEYNAYGPANTRVILRPNGAKDYAIADHLGSLRLLLGDNGVIKEQRSYGPFGEDLISDGDGARTSYIGRENDHESNLGFFGVRHYDPTYGRFMSVDPLWAKYAPLQPYHYAGNEPVGRLDWDGRDIIMLLDEQGASGAGHIAVLIGNDKEGWYLYSKNAGKYSVFGESVEPDVGVRFNTLAEFREKRGVIDDYDRYDKAWIFPSSTEQDNAAKDAAKKEAKSYYLLCGASCNDVAKVALQAAGLKLGDGSVVPNVFYGDAITANRYPGDRRGRNVGYLVFGSGKPSLYERNEESHREITDSKRDEMRRLLDATGGFDKDAPRCRTK